MFGLKISFSYLQGWKIKLEDKEHDIALTHPPFLLMFKDNNIFLAKIHKTLINFDHRAKKTP